MNAVAQTHTSSITRDPRWKRLVHRDPRADGEFFYSVKTTGVYCRPSCGARPARPENVAFHRTTAEAERAGFRPCKRCRPNEPPADERRAALVAEVCRQIEDSDSVPSLDELATSAGLSVSHLHRMFRAVTGLTPRGYAAAHRAKRVRSELGESASVTQAIYGAGYASSGRFYETSNAMLGMTPSAFKRGGTGIEIRFAVAACSLGKVLVAATARGVCAILLGDEARELERDLERRFSRAKLLAGDASFEALVEKVVDLVEAPHLGVSLPLDIRGTAFQERVWKALREIPPGERATYTEVAAAIDQPKAVRAVAQACGANALAVAIPCHRVVRADGDLSGYRWGVTRKRALLERERATRTKRPR